jgi:hypothetical protein
MTLELLRLRDVITKRGETAEGQTHVYCSVAL